MKKLIPLMIALFSFSLFAQDASVVSSHANLREAPSVKAKVVRVLTRGTGLAITNQKGNWYMVRTGKISGWLHAMTIMFREKSGKKPRTTKKIETGKVPIKARFVGQLGNPTLTVKNRSTRKLNLLLGGVLYEIESGTEKTIQLKKGSYEYTATAEGLPTVSGVKLFDKKRVYTWSFEVAEPKYK